MSAFAASHATPSIGLVQRGSPTPRRQRFVPDHPGWFRVEEPVGGWCRLAVGDARGPLVLTSPGIEVATGGLRQPTTIRLPEGAHAVLPAGLASRLSRMSPLVRVPTPSVWEAAATAVIRQVVHRDQARAAFIRICTLFGPRVLIGGQARSGFPTADAIASVGADAIRVAGIGFKARTLETLAAWCLDTREHLGADELHEALLDLRGIGPWTAAVAVCDRFSDFARYPVDDLAVRSHARACWPERRWPEHPSAFAREWRAATAPYTGEITAFVLAIGALSSG